MSFSVCWVTPDGQQTTAGGGCNATGCMLDELLLHFLRPGEASKAHQMMNDAYGPEARGLSRIKV